MLKKEIIAKIEARIKAITAELRNAEGFATTEFRAQRAELKGERRALQWTLELMK